MPSAPVFCLLFLFDPVSFSRMVLFQAYDGRRPQICISDPKLIRLITTADFDHFRNHGWDFGSGSESTSIFANLLDLLNGMASF